MSDRSRTGNSYRFSSFRNSGRWAGAGITEDDYSEESCSGFGCNHRVHPVFPHDDIKPEELNGQCIVIQKGNRGDIE